MSHVRGRPLSSQIRVSKIDRYSRIHSKFPIRAEMRFSFDAVMKFLFDPLCCFFYSPFIIFFSSSSNSAPYSNARGRRGGLRDGMGVLQVLRTCELSVGLLFDARAPQPSLPRGAGVSRVTDFPSPPPPPPPPLPSATMARFPRRPFSVGKSRRGAPIGRRAERRTRQGSLVRGKWAGASKTGFLRAPGFLESGSVASMCSADPGGENSPSSSSALPPLSSSSSLSPKGNFAGDATSHRKCGWKNRQ